MRDYKKEYANYHSKPKQKKDRAGILGRDVDHKDRNPRNNSASNLRIQSKSKNRSRNG